MHSSIVLALLVLTSPDLVQCYEPECTIENSYCICSIGRTIGELAQLISDADPSWKGVLEHQIQSYQCVSFDRLPNSGLLTFSEDDTESHDKRVKRAKRSPGKPLIRRKRKVSKEKDPPQVESSSEPNEKYGLLGSQVDLRCFPKGSDLDDMMAQDYSWTYSDGRPLTSSRMQIENGLVTFESIQLADAGDYNCSVTLKDFNSGKAVRRTFLHRVIVISVPVYGLQLRFGFTSDFCSRSEMKLVQKSLETFVTSTVCPICRVAQSEIKCKSNEQFASQSGDYAYDVADKDWAKRDYIFTMLLYPDGFSIDSIVGINKCDFICKKTLALKMTTILRNSMIKVVNLKILALLPGKESYHFPLKKLFAHDLMETCMPGYFLDLVDHVCYPCQRGEYSSVEGHGIECRPCPVGSYQDSPASSACIPCKSGQVTLLEGSTRKKECMLKAYATMIKFGKKRLIAILIAIVVTIILIPLGCIAYCCPRSKFGAFLNRFCCCCFPCCGTRMDYKGIAEKAKKKREKERLIKRDAAIIKRPPRPPPPPPPGQFKYRRPPPPLPPHPQEEHLLYKKNKIKEPIKPPRRNKRVATEETNTTGSEYRGNIEDVLTEDTQASSGYQYPYPDDEDISPPSLMPPPPPPPFQFRKNSR